MKLQYDREADALIILLRDADIQESDELRPGIIVDLAANGDVVRLEILDASRQIEGLDALELAIN